jgi:transposase
MAISKKHWLFVKEWSADIPSTVIKLLDTRERWRRMARLLKLSKPACLRLEWMIYYHDHSATDTARHFGIARKTFHHWYARFDETNLRALEDRSKRPKQVRQKEYAPIQYERFLSLRRAHLRYGKLKLLKIYQRLYPDDASISSWKIQCMIERSGLYYHPRKQAQINRKRQLSVKRKKITDLKKKPKSGFLVCLATVVRYVNNKK